MRIWTSHRESDVMWALKSAPKEGRLPVTVVREAKQEDVLLVMPNGWKKPDLSWRRSISKLKK